MVDSIDESQRGFWIFLHPRELFAFTNAAPNEDDNPKWMKPFYLQFYIVLRMRMNGKTREVRNCSWAHLRTEMELPIIQRSHDEDFGKPSEKKLRYAAEALQKLGLIEIKSENRELVFWLKKAPSKQEIDDYRESLSPCRGAEEGQTQRGRPDPRKNKGCVGGGGALEGQTQRGSLSSISSNILDTTIATHTSLPLETLQPTPTFTNSKKRKNIKKEKKVFDYSDPGFQEFWEAYPKKSTKLESYELWMANQLGDELPVILADIAARKQVDAHWLEGYHLDPVRYLKRRRWEDEDKGERKVEAPRKKSYLDEQHERLMARAAKLDKEWGNA